MPRIVLVICLVCLAVTPAAARMYQWRNPATGTTQMSGTPPAWYRGTDRGPRVFVFDNNQLIDDTGIAVSEAQRAALRAEAFGVANEQARAAAEPPAPRDAGAPAVPEAAATVAAPAAQPPTTPAAPVDAATADKAASLKALIDAWDQRQLDQARSLLDMMPADGKAAPAKP